MSVGLIPFRSGRIVALAVLVALAVPSLGSGSSGKKNASAEQYSHLFEDRYSKAAALQATFLERYSENGVQLRVETGDAYFLRPDKMRWEYRAPEQNVFVVDGKWAWFYVPADHTATRVPARRSSDWRTPLALLAGKMKVSRFCQSVELAAGGKVSEANTVMLRCVLRGNGNAGAPNGDLTGSRTEGVRFELDRDTGELRRILVDDAGGVRVEFSFANWKFDPALDEKQFRFTPPRGTAIVDGDLDAGRKQR